MVGGGLAGMAAVRELSRQFEVIVVDPKEYFEFTSGIMRAYARPSHWDSLTFLYHTVLERTFGVSFIWGEVLSVDVSQKLAHVKSVFAEDVDEVAYDYCLVTGGCNFNQSLPTGESLWFPLVHGRNRAESAFQHLDERYLEGRRRRILEEHHSLQRLNRQQANVLVVGAGFMGVEWACELQHFFPSLRITLSDFLPRCLGPLPEAAAGYCEEYMQRVGIRTRYGLKYDPESRNYWEKLGLPNGADKTYVLTGASNSNYFMPKGTLSGFGPGGGGWILTNKNLQVVTRSNQVSPSERSKAWGDGVVFAAGDCIVGCVGAAPNWEIPPMPKTGYAAEQQAVHACRNIRALGRSAFGSSGPGARAGCLCGGPTSLRPTWYPWGAGIFAVSLGPHDGCVVVGASSEKNSGRLWSRGWAAAAQKELIETTKLAQCRGDHLLSSVIWHLIHHFPIHLWGAGPLVAC